MASASSAFTSGFSSSCLGLFGLDGFRRDFFELGFGLLGLRRLLGGFLLSGLLFLHFGLFDQLKEAHFGRIAATHAELQNPGIAAVAALIGRGDLIEQELDGILVAQLRNRDAAGGAGRPSCRS